MEHCLGVGLLDIEADAVSTFEHRLALGETASEQSAHAPPALEVVEFSPLADYEKTTEALMD